MWRLAIGAVLGFLPQRWRNRMGLGLDQAIPWTGAGILSGLVEALVGTVGLLYWYSRSVTTWAANALDSALRGGPEAQVPGQAIGFSALVLWMLHPLTWFIGYFAMEGIVRFLAAISTERVHGSLPLVVADWCYGKISARPPEGDQLHAPTGKEYIQSLATTVKEKVMTARLPELEDELVDYAQGGAQMLEIRATRPKSDWVPPRVVRMGQSYYRLEEALSEKPPRPFVFRLRRLEAGVPGRTVIMYEAPRAEHSDEPKTE
jgi:hypothetical protein